MVCQFCIVGQDGLKYHDFGGDDNRPNVLIVACNHAHESAGSNGIYEIRSN
jgi:hypothetical protein